MKSELDAERLPPAFAAMVGQLRASLYNALASVDVLIAHNVCSLNKNLALTTALHDLHAETGTARMILWHHDLAWTTPRYRSELHEGWPWDLLRTVVMPSREEGFGIPVLEEGLSRLAIFCSDIPSLRELAGDRAVYFSPDAGPEQLADQVAARLVADDN